MRILGWVGSSLLFGCQVATSVGVYDGGKPGVAAVQLARLDGSLDVLREDFNAHQDELRVIALLSSTEGPCILGARALRESVLESYPDADLRVDIVWMEMLPSDCPESAVGAAQLFDDQRVRHFYDASKVAGRGFAQGLLPIGVAWDIYMFYPPGERWSDGPPRPARWAHQLGRIDPQHYHPGERLFGALGEAMEAMLAEQATRADVARPE